MNIGTLTIEMAANVARLTQDLQAARGAVDRSFQSIGSAASKLKTLVGGVFAGIAVGSLIDAVDRVKTAAVDIERLAAASGASLDEFQRAAAGAKTLGVNVEKFGDIMKDTQDKLGDFLLTGGGELKDFFETIGPKVGVTAESFRNLSGPHALQLFYTSLEKANVGQKVMIQQMESIANDASMLAPLLANGGAEFKALGEEAAKAGALMSSELIYASKALGEEMMRMDTVTVGISNSIMSGLIPAITEMAAASREELSAGFEAVSAWVQDNKEQLLGAWEITKAIGAEVWSVVRVALELAVGIGKWAVESGFLEASLITIGLLVAGFKDGVDIVGAAFAKLGSIILNAVAKPMSGFLNDVGVVLKWAGQGDLAGVFLDAAEGIKTAGEAGAQYAAGVASKFAAGDTAVARFTASLGESSKSAVTAAKSTYTAYQALGTGAGISAKAAEEAKKSADKAAAATKKLAEDGAKLAASLLAIDGGLSGDFAEKWAKLSAAYGANKISIEKLTQAQAALLEDQPAMKAAADARKKQLEEEAQAWEDVRSAMTEYRRAQEQKAQELSDGNQGLREEIELIGLSSKKQAEVLRQRSEAIILTKQATLAEMERASAISGTMTREQIALAEEIRGLEERNELLGAKEARESWSGFWESVGSTAHDVFVNVADEGMSAFKRIGKTLKSAVLDMLYQMTVKKWIISIAGSMAGGGAMAGGGEGGSFGVGDAMNAASGVRTVTGMNSGWFTDFGSTLPGSISSTGAQLYSKGFETVGSSMMDFGNSIAGYADAINIAGDVLGYGAAIFAAANGKWGQAIGSAVGTYFGGPIGGFIGSTLGKWADKLFSGGAGTLHMGAGVQYSAAQGVRGGADIYNRSTFGMGARDEYADGVEKLISGVAMGIVSVLDGVAVTFGKTAGYELATAFADDSNKDGAWGSLRISKEGQELINWQDAPQSKWAPKEFADGEDGYKEYLGAIAKDTRQVLLDMDLPSWADTLLNSIGEAASMEQLSQAVMQIGQIQTMFVQLGQTVDGFAGMGDKAFEALMAASGGAEALAQNVGSFYANFYTEEERAAKSTAALTEELAKFGKPLPATKEAYRALFEEATKAGVGGAALAAKLLQLNPAFAQVADAAEQAKQKAEEANKEMVAAAGISGETIATTLRDALLGRVDAAEAGASIGKMVTDGIYNALASGFTQQLTDLMMTSLITPVIQAAIAGTSVSEAVSAGAIDNMIAAATRAAEALDQIFSDADFLAAIGRIGDAINGIVAGAAGGRGAGGGSTGSTGGGGSNNLFAIGGSATGGYRPPQELSSLSALTEQTLESNKKVSELLQKLLNPEKLFVNRYAALDDQLATQRKTLGADTYQSQINALRAQIADASGVNAVIDPLMDVLNRMASSWQSTGDDAAKDGIFDTLTDLIISRGKVNESAGTVGYYALGGVAGTSIEERVNATLREAFNSAAADGGSYMTWFDGYINELMGITSEPWKLGADLQTKTAQLAELETQLREWYIAQARVIAVEDMAEMASETTAAKAKTAELKRTGGLEDPVTKLKEQLAQKMRGIDDGIGKALLAEVDRLKANKPSDKILTPLNNAVTNHQRILDEFENTLSPDGTAIPGFIAAAKAEVAKWESSLVFLDDAYSAAAAIGDMSGVDAAITSAVFSAEGLRKAQAHLAKLQDPAAMGAILETLQANVAGAEQAVTAALIAATDPAKQQALLDEIATYKGGITEWYKAQAELLSTEMLVDINQQIKALQAEEKGPLATIKDAIQKYIDDLTALGTLDATAQAAIDKLSGLQLDKARDGLYDQLRTKDEIKIRDSADLAAQFADVGKAVPATTTALRDMIDAARLAGNNTLADKLLELVPAFVALQGAADDVGAQLRSATDSAFAALERAVGVQRDLLNEQLRIVQQRIGLEDALLGLLGNTAKQRERELQALDESNRALQARVWALQDATQATDGAYAALERAVGAQREAAQEVATHMQAIVSMTRDAARDLYGEVESTRQQSRSAGQAFIEQALANAQATGYMPDADKLREAIDGVRNGIAQQQGASSFEAERDRLVLAGKLTDLQDIAEPQLTEAQLQLAALEEMLKTARTQIDAMRGIDTSFLSTAEAQRVLQRALAAEGAARDAAAAAIAQSDSLAVQQALNDQLTALDATLEAARTQIDELRGINTSVLSVSGAMTALAAAIAAEAARAITVTVTTTPATTGAGGGGGGGASNADLIANAYQSLLGRAPDADGAAHWANALASGSVSAAGLQSAITSSAAGWIAANGMDAYTAQFGASSTERLQDLIGFEVGINRVPFDMTARIHEGEAVVPAHLNPFNPNAKSNGLGGNTERLEALVEGLTAEVQRLQGIVARGVEHQRETAEILDNVTEGGSAMRSEVVA